MKNTTNKSVYNECNSTYKSKEAIKQIKELAAEYKKTVPSKNN